MTARSPVSSRRWKAPSAWPPPSSRPTSSSSRSGAVRRRSGPKRAIAAWSFHVGVLTLMLIAFAYPLSFVAYAPFFRVERLLDSRPYLWLRARLRLSAA